MEPDRPATTPQYQVNRSTEVPTRVTVVDFDMSFGHLVAFFVKAAIAAIPAAIILGILAFLVMLVLGGVGGFLAHR